MKISKKVILGITIAFTAYLGALTPTVFAATETVYDALPSVSPDTNYPSQPFQAQQVYEFGDLIHLGGTNRSLNSITVTMSDWAKYSDYISDTSYSGNSVNWTHPITLNVYNVVPGTPNTVGTLLGTVTQTITIPWRPESDSSCGSTSNGKGWLKDGVCYDYSGIAFNAVFDLSSLNVTLPDDIIVSVAYNTQTYGLAPIGVNGPYNSLNVAVPNNQSVSVGTDDPDSVFLDSTWSGAFVNGSLAGLGLKEDSGWAPNGTVALQVTVQQPFQPVGLITNPVAEGDLVSGSFNFTATYDDGDAVDDDAVQWAIRQGTCVAGVGTVAGNVDSFSNPFTWDGASFGAIVDTSGFTPGNYCFVFNPTDDEGQNDVREIRNFVVDAVNPNPFPVPAQCNQNIAYNLIEGSSKSEKINGTNGADLILAMGGSDKVDGKGGDDCIVGGDGSDRLVGGNGDDVILGGVGSDSIDGNNGNDSLYGEDGSDSIRGGSGNDMLSGGDQSDSLRGDGGVDTIDGGAGSDSANGGGGSDTCTTAEAESSCEI